MDCGDSVGRLFREPKFFRILQIFCFTRKLLHRDITYILCKNSLLRGGVTRIHCNLPDQYGVIEVLQVDYSYCLTWRVFYLPLCHRLQLFHQIVKDLVDVARPTVFVIHGYVL